MAPPLRCIPAAMVLVLSCTCVVPLRGHKPARVDPLTVPHANPQCWDSSSALLLEMRAPRIADTVPAFWDLMVSLRSSDNSKHTALFWDLAQVFWDLYLDCVLSRSHGLGRRHVTAMHSLFTDSKPFKLHLFHCSNSDFQFEKKKKKINIANTYHCYPLTFVLFFPTNEGNFELFLLTHTF